MLMIQHLRKFSKDIKSEDDFVVKHLQKCIQKPIFERQFGIRKFPKKLVISLLFCNFIVENQ